MLGVITSLNSRDVSVIVALIAKTKPGTNALLWTNSHNFVEVKDIESFQPGIQCLYI